MTRGNVPARSRRSGRPRRGMAMILALTLLALAGAIVVIVGRSFARDFQFTQAAGDEAQLRQLLLAGATDAMVKLNAGGEMSQPWNVALPKELTAARGVLRVTAQQPKPDDVVLTVHGELAGRSREQQLHFTRTDGRWRLVAASLG